MRFKYKKYAKNTVRPVIPVKLRYRQKTIPYEVLVDSGADMNIFDIQIGRLLGIDVESGEVRRVTGITGTPAPYYLHNVRIVVGGHEFKTVAGFKQFGDLGYGVVGQAGFFELFKKIIFDYNKETVELRLK